MKLAVSKIASKFYSRTYLLDKLRRKQGDFESQYNVLCSISQALVAKCPNDL